MLLKGLPSIFVPSLLIKIERESVPLKLFNARNRGDWHIFYLMSTVSYFINLFETRLILETSLPVFVVLNEGRRNGWVSSLAARKPSLHQSIPISNFDSIRE